MSWLFSQALVEEYLGENFSDGEQSAPLSGSSIQQAYCAPDKMTSFSRLSRFGMTYKPLTESPGQELLTLYLEDFHAKTLAQLEKAQELMENEVECGEKWHGSFVKFDPSSSLWKTHQCSLLGDLEEFSETWPQWGLMRNGECWEQQMLEQTIKGTGFGLSPNGVDSFHTPNTTGLDGGSNSRKALRKRIEKFPTPVVHDYKVGAKGYGLGAMFHKKNQATWPTPLSTEYKANRVKRKNHQNGLTQAVLETQDGGQLNQMWVEWLMGWPIGWTDLKPLEMDKFHFVQQQHGES
jgi:hypothetical protein